MQTVLRLFKNSDTFLHLIAVSNDRGENIFIKQMNFIYTRL